MFDKNNPPERISYDSWMQSPLSVAKYYGGCTINGVRYECDYDNCPTKQNEEGETKYFPDLIRVK